ncbi:MAG: acyl-CoA-binding protein [Bacteriovoracaceae bacterium]|nr:acyl-CoA-binding protein [Bacteriovoracaceae bacterium]
MAKSLKSEFKKASEDVKELETRPSNDTLLELYSLYKQGTDGDVKGKRPGMIDIKGRKKYDSWAKIAGMETKVAQQNYVDLVKKLQKS